MKVSIIKSIPPIMGAVFVVLITSEWKVNSSVISENTVSVKKQEKWGRTSSTNRILDPKYIDLYKNNADYEEKVFKYTINASPSYSTKSSLGGWAILVGRFKQDLGELLSSKPTPDQEKFMSLFNLWILMHDPERPFNPLDPSRYSPTYLRDAMVSINKELAALGHVFSREQLHIELNDFQDVLKKEFEYLDNNNMQALNAAVILKAREYAVDSGYTAYMKSRKYGFEGDFREFIRGMEFDKDIQIGFSSSFDNFEIFKRRFDMLDYQKEFISKKVIYSENIKTNNFKNNTVVTENDLDENIKKSVESLVKNQKVVDKVVQLAVDDVKGKNGVNVRNKVVSLMTDLHMKNFDSHRMVDGNQILNTYAIYIAARIKADGTYSFDIKSSYVKAQKYGFKGEIIEWEKLVRSNKELNHLFNDIRFHNENHINNIGDWRVLKWYMALRLREHAIYELAHVYQSIRRERADLKSIYDLLRLVQDDGISKRSEYFKYFNIQPNELKKLIELNI